VTAENERQVTTKEMARKRYIIDEIKFGVLHASLLSRRMKQEKNKSTEKLF